MDGVAGQPDWQRYQSSTGPTLFSATGATPLSSAILPMGPWRSWWLKGHITAGTGTWTITVSWYLDPSGLALLSTDTIIVGNGVDRIGWKPVLAGYVQFSAVLTHATTGDQMSVTVVPSLLESLVGGRATQVPYINVYENALSHNLFTEYNATYTMAGPAVMDVRANDDRMVYDLYEMDGTGAFTAVRRYQVNEIDEARQYALILPDKPVRIRASNVSNLNRTTFDINLSPA